MKIPIKQPRLNQKIKSVVLLFFIIFCQNVFSASFDCLKATNLVEEYICNDSYLSALDEKLAAVYNFSKNSVSDDIQLKELKNEQIYWIFQIRNKCTNASCIRESYQSRINQLIEIYVVEKKEEISIADSKKEVPPKYPEASPIESRNLHEGEVQKDKQSIVESPNIEAYPENRVSTNVVPLETKKKQDVITLNNKTEERVTVEDSTSSKSLYIKIGIILLLVNFLATVRFQKLGKLTIFENFTDAAITGTIFITPIILFFVLSFLEMPDRISGAASFGFFVFLFFVVVMSTIKNNRNILMFLMCIFTKITIIALYLLILFVMLGIFFKRHLDTKETFLDKILWEIDKRKIANYSWEITFGYIFTLGFLSKEKKFVSLKDYAKSFLQ